MEKCGRRLIDLSFEPIVSSQAQADPMLKSETDKWSRMGKAVGLTIK